MCCRGGPRAWFPLLSVLCSGVQSLPVPSQYLMLDWPAPLSRVKLTWPGGPGLNGDLTCWVLSWAFFELPAGPEDLVPVNHGAGCFFMFVGALISLDVLWLLLLVDVVTDWRGFGVNDCGSEGDAVFNDFPRRFWGALGRV